MKTQNQTVGERLAALTETLQDTIMGTAEKTAEAAERTVCTAGQVAVERINAEADAACLMARLEANASVLGALGAQKLALQERRDKEESGVLQLLYDRQLEAITAQELAVLERAGAPKKVAREALEYVDAPGRSLDPVRGRCFANNGHK